MAPFVRAGIAPCHGAQPLNSALIVPVPRVSVRKCERKPISPRDGTGTINTLFNGYAPWLGPIPARTNGAMVSDREGVATPYALFHLQERGVLFVPPGTPVYEGMVVGEYSRDTDLDVNVCREKKLTNMRASGHDEAVRLVPHRTMDLEDGLEWIDEDELVEVTPDTIRLRKKELRQSFRPRGPRSQRAGGPPPVTP